MGRRLLALAMFVVFVARVAAQDAASAESAYRAAVAAATAEYVRILKEAVVVETKKGDLDAALAVRDKIKAIECKASIGSLLPKLAGTHWIADKGATFEWKADSTFLHKGGVRPCIAVDATHLVIYFDPTRVDVLEFDKDLTKFERFQLSSQPKSIEAGKRKGGDSPCLAVDATRVVNFFDNTRVDVLVFDKELTKFEHCKLSSQPKPIEAGKRAAK
jgi:hypothetical protein